MSTTPKEFTQQLTAVGGVERLPKQPGRIAKWLGVKGVEHALHDIFDAVQLNYDKKDRFIVVHGTDRLARVFIPVANRDMAFVALRQMGIEAYDTYSQVGVEGNKWTQVSLNGDPEFRAYAATRTLLDSAPEEGGVVGISAAELHLAVTGIPVVPTDN